MIVYINKETKTFTIAVHKGNKCIEVGEEFWKDYKEARDTYNTMEWQMLNKLSDTNCNKQTLREACKKALSELLHTGFSKYDDICLKLRNVIEDNS